MSERFDVKGAADYLGMSVSFLNTRRVKGGGPVFLKKGRRVEYRKADLDSWEESCRRTSTSQAVPA